MFLIMKLKLVLSSNLTGTLRPSNILPCMYTSESILSLLAASQLVIGNCMSSYQLVVDKCTQYSVIAYGEKLLFNLVQQLVNCGMLENPECSGTEWNETGSNCAQHGRWTHG